MKKTVCCVHRGSRILFLHSYAQLLSYHRLKCVASGKERFEMYLIVATGKDWAIGKDGGLLVENPVDMKFFRETTMGKVVIMVRKTVESFHGGTPLKNRVNIVLCIN